MTNRYQVGVVSAMWRFPVKSMIGQPLIEAMVSERGVDGDRQWALRELKYGGIMSARAFPMLLALKASWSGGTADGDDDAAVTIEMPDGRTLATSDPSANAVLSAFLKREVRLERVRTTRPTQAEFAAIMRGEAMPPNRDFFDEDVIHLIASGTLAHLRELQGESHDCDARRFRANILVDTGAVAPGFLEDAWLEGTLELGDQSEHRDRIRIAGIRPALRCAVITHPLADLPHDPSILRTAHQHHQAYVGVFAAVASAGTIRIGDPVWFSSE
jgi:uncharacterized protein